MTCNGFGHPPNCNCGWGGVFHENIGQNYSLEYWHRLESHTNPNARCPRCSRQVFFYRSPEGGAVFFDHLGSPWPKHECMTLAEHGTNVEIASVRKRPGTWPFPWVEKWGLPEREGACLRDADDRLLLVRTSWMKIPSCTPIWISKHSTIQGRYRASLPRLKGERVIESAYEAFSVESLKILENARFFRATIHMLNTHEINRRGGTDARLQA